MTDKRREELVDKIAALSDPPDLMKLKKFLRSLTPFALRERYEIIVEQSARDARDYAEMMKIAEERAFGADLPEPEITRVDAPWLGTNCGFVFKEHK